MTCGSCLILRVYFTVYVHEDTSHIVKMVYYLPETAFTVWFFMRFVRGALNAWSSRAVGSLIPISFILLILKSHVEMNIWNIKVSI